MSYRPEAASAVTGRAKSFKKLRDAEDVRKRRGDALSKLRKERRDEQLEKRRKEWDVDIQNEASGKAAASGSVRDGTSLSASTPSTTSTQIPMADDSKSHMENLIQVIASSESVDARLNSTRRLRKLLSKRGNPPISRAIQAGAVSCMLSQLQNMTTPQIQVEAAWVLTNITSGTSSQTRVVLEHGVAQVNGMH